MSKKELELQKTLLLIENKKLTMKEGATQLGLSLRHLRRCRRQYEQHGLAGLVHKSRGRPSGRALPQKDQMIIKRLLHERYPDFGPTFAAEKLSIDLGKTISREKVRQIQIEEGLHKAKKRRNAKYHPRRKRRDRIGELIQTDGSDHLWLEDRAERMTLITFIDDATSGIMHARFVESECTDAYMSLTKSYIETFGSPKAFYVDKHSIFRQNNGSACEQGKFTNFGRALKELNIELICAHSPQAKGRVERGFGVLQDRLIKEMRLAKIQSMDEANTFLPHFLTDYNQRFSVLPAEEEDAHTPVNESQDLNLVFTSREPRKLSKNLTFQYSGVLYQVYEPNLVNRLRNQKVEIRTNSEQQMRVVSSWGQPLNFEAYEESGLVQRTLDSKDLEKLWVNKRRKPSKYHPWR